MTDGWVHAPVPDRSPWEPDQCGVCHHGNLTFTRGGFVEPITRTVELVDGAYLVRPHHGWCPELTGADPDGCPVCGSTIVQWDMDPAYSVAMPHLLFETAHLVGGYDEIGHGLVAASAEPARQPGLVKLVVRPCGHTVQGAQAREVLARRAAAESRRRAATAAKTLEADRKLLAAANDAGYGSLTRAYEAAVRSGRSPGTANGLREALLLLCPDVTT